MLPHARKHFSHLQEQMCANYQAMYAPNDIPLLKYYQDQSCAMTENICLLQPEYYVERLAESYVRKNYLSKHERENYAITCENGTWLNADGFKLNDAYLYCLLPDNRLYAVSIDISADQDDQPIRNHSHLVAGLPVKAAGFLYFKEGTLVTISNDSGHYKPSAQNMLPALRWFTERARLPILFEDHSEATKMKPNVGIRHCDTRTNLPHPDNWLSISSLEQFLTTHHKIPSREEKSAVSKTLNYSTDELINCQSTIDNIPYTGLQGNITVTRFRSRKKGWAAP